jgi:hypothetical protein
MAPAACNTSEPICDAVQTSKEPASFSISVDVRLGEPHLSDDDLSVRRECFEDWFSELGFDQQVRWSRTRAGQASIRLSASWPEVVPVLAPAAVVSYSIGCGEALCTHCAELSEAQCPSDPFCMPYVIWPLSAAGDGCDAPRFAECIAFEYGCATAPGFVIDQAGQCWWDTGQCEPLVYLQSTLECGDTEVPLPGCGD